MSNLFNLSGELVVLTPFATIMLCLLCYMILNHAMICDISLMIARLLNMLNLVAKFTMIYIMELI